MTQIQRCFIFVNMIHNNNLHSGFKDCIGRKYNSEASVAERDICAMPTYFNFFTPDKPVRIVFDKKVLFSKSVNHKNFLEFQIKINKTGYSTYDLS